MQIHMIFFYGNVFPVGLGKFGCRSIAESRHGGVICSYICSFRKFRPNSGHFIMDMFHSNESFLFTESTSPNQKNIIQASKVFDL